MKKIVQESTRAYREGTDAELIQELEENVMEEDLEPKMEEWGDLILTRETPGEELLYTSKPCTFSRC